MGIRFATIAIMSRSRLAWFKLAFIALFVLIVVWFLRNHVLDEGWYTLKYWTQDNRNEVVRNLGLLLAGAFGLGFGIWRSIIALLNVQAAQRQAATTEQGQITERFTAAVRLLGDVNSTVRTGGIYALGRIARDSVERDHLAVMQLLVNYIRLSPYSAEGLALIENYARQLDRHQKKVEANAGEQEVLDGLELAPAPPLRECPDIHAAIEVVARKTSEQCTWEKDSSYVPSFGGAYLMFLNLQGGSFSRFKLRNADFEWSDLKGAEFKCAELQGADFSGAQLQNALFQSADLRDTDLKGTNLRNAQFQGADLRNADLRGANLGAATIVSEFGLVHERTPSNFEDADLREAILAGIPLKGVNFQRANLERANLTEVSYLDQQTLKLCKPSAPPLHLPEGLRWPFVKKNGDWVGEN